MHKYLTSFLKKKDKKAPLSNFMTSDFMTFPDKKEINRSITNEQIKILENAIREYNKLEDVKKFTKMALYEIDRVTEEDILNAVELEKKISIEDDIAVKKLLESEGLLADIYGDDYKDYIE